MAGVGPKRGLTDDPLVRCVCGLFQWSWLLDLGSVLADPEGFIANGSSNSGFLPYLNL